MSSESRPMTVRPATIRRLAVVKQHLAGRPPARPKAAAILALIRDMGCVQLDPINVVAPSHLIVLWSRLGSFDRSELDALFWRDRTLFEYWGHQASIVLMEDYPLYYGMMRGDPETTPTPLAWWGSTWQQRIERWQKENAKLRQYVLQELRARGPLLSRQLEDPTGAKKRTGTGWGSGGNLSRMLQVLFFCGEIMVAGRSGNQKMWDLAEKCLPPWVVKKAMSSEEVEYQAVQRSLLALGVATAPEIRYHFLRDRYPNLKRTLERLVSESKVHRVKAAGASDKQERYVHDKDLSTLEDLESGKWEPRTTLLSPFDNLICDRKRTELVFGFKFRFEAYVPKEKREYGAYVLPILHGDRLIGRVDPLLDRKTGRLLINAVHAEARAPSDKDTAREVADAIERLSEFLGAREVVYSRRVPDFWRSSMR